MECQPFSNHMDILLFILGYLFICLFIYLFTHSLFVSMLVSVVHHIIFCFFVRLYSHVMRIYFCVQKKKVQERFPGHIGQLFGISVYGGGIMKLIINIYIYILG